MQDFPEYPVWEKHNIKLVEWGDVWTLPIIFTGILLFQLVRIIAYYL